MEHTLTRNTHWAVFALTVVSIIMAETLDARAQGQIYGTVENTALSNPLPGELLWIGFLDDTDEEIRIESCTGAGYDGLHWFDDFQNYTTETAGSPYDYVFVDLGSGEAYRLQNTIPANSFQEENIALVPSPPPARPAGLTANVVSPTQIGLHWNSETGLTYHVYRRVTSNNSVFFRLDDPAGNLANPGVAGGGFADMTSDGVSEYSYTIVAEDNDGHYSAHSDEITVLASEPGCSCPAQADLDSDGFATAIDMSRLIDVLFSGGADMQDPSCPSTRSDYDCDGFPTSLDLSGLVDHLFGGGAPPCDPCAL
jgi:hypothetical protein